MEEIYIHYGSDHFSPTRFKEITNSPRGWNKPIGGLWASPKPTPSHSDEFYYTSLWKDWCLYNDYKVDRLEKSFEFTLAKNSKVLYLNDVIKFNDSNWIFNDESLKSCIEIKFPGALPSILSTSIYMDFELLKKRNYDAIYVAIDDDFYYPLYGWDVDSLLVMNPNCIVER